MAGVFVLMLSGCPGPKGPHDGKDPDAPPPIAVPQGEGEDTPIGKMCLHLRELGCPEGQPKTKNGKTRTCYQALTIAESNAGLPTACAIAAPTREAVRACGDPSREITIRCVIE